VTKEGIVWGKDEGAGEGAGEVPEPRKGKLQRHAHGQSTLAVEVAKDCSVDVPLNTPGVKVLKEIMPMVWDEYLTQIITGSPDLACSMGAATRHMSIYERVRVLDYVGDGKKSVAFDFHVAEGDVFLDVGGHIGLASVDALLKGAARAIIVEPIPDNLVLLRRNLAQFGDRVTIVEKCVVPEGAADTARMRSNGWRSKVVKSGGDCDAGTTTLQALIHQYHPTMVKMDIEGAEVGVLKQNIDWGACERLCFEYTITSESAAELQAALNAAGWDTKSWIPRMFKTGVNHGPGVDHVLFCTRAAPAPAVSSIYDRLNVELQRTTRDESNGAGEKKKVTGKNKKQSDPSKSVYGGNNKRVRSEKQKTRQQEGTEVLWTRSLASAIIAATKAKSANQTQLARIVGCRPTVVSHWLCGRTGGRSECGHALVNWFQENGGDQALIAFTRPSAGEAQKLVISDTDGSEEEEAESASEHSDENGDGCEDEEDEDGGEDEYEEDDEENMDFSGDDDYVPKKKRGGGAAAVASKPNPNMKPKRKRKARTIEVSDTEGEGEEEKEEDAIGAGPTNDGRQLEFKKNEATSTTISPRQSRTAKEEVLELTDRRDIQGDLQYLATCKTGSTRWFRVADLRRQTAANEGSSMDDMVRELDLQVDKAATEHKTPPLSKVARKAAKTVGKAGTPAIATAALEGGRLFRAVRNSFGNDDENSDEDTE
jgi:FkbM family methyltransferase